MAFVIQWSAVPNFSSLKVVAMAFSLDCESFDRSPSVKLKVERVKFFLLLLGLTVLEDVLDS